MTDRTDIDKLRELAEAATPGPWEWSVSVDRQWALVETAEDNLRILAQLRDDDDAAFIAAASPDVILALTAELVGLRTEVDQLRTDNERLMTERIESEDWKTMYLAVVGAEEPKSVCRRAMPYVAPETRCDGCGHRAKSHSLTRMGGCLACVGLAAEGLTDQAEAQQ